jgi:hypothetical protein
MVVALEILSVGSVIATTPDRGGERAHNAEQRWEDQCDHVNVLALPALLKRQESRVRRFERLFWASG